MFARNKEVQMNATRYHAIVESFRVLKPVHEAVYWDDTKTTDMSISARSDTTNSRLRSRGGSSPNHYPYHEITHLPGGLLNRLVLVLPRS